MYFGLGDKSDPKAQQGSHLMNSYSRDPNPAPPPRQQTDMHQDVMAFERKLQYDNLVHAGVSPVKAAQQVGKNVPMGSMLTPKDIKQIIETGTVQKSRIG